MVVRVVRPATRASVTRDGVLVKAQTQADAQKSGGGGLIGSVEVGAVLAAPGEVLCAAADAGDLPVTRHRGASWPPVEAA